MEIVLKEKTTEEDFELFKFRCSRWQKFFGLINFVISYRHKKIDDDAQCAYSDSGKWAVITLSTEVNEYEHSDHFIKELALHEICELLISNLASMARLRFNYEEVEVAEHEIVMRLVNVLLSLEDKIFEDEDNRTNLIIQSVLDEEHKEIFGASKEI